MKHRLHPIFSRFLAPAGDDGADTGGTDTVDRGDDFVPTDDDADAQAAAAAKTDDKVDDKAAKTDDKTDDKDADKDADKDTDKDKGARIPVSRHKAMLDKARAERDEIAQRLAQYEKGDRIAVINDDIKKAEDRVAALDTEYSKLITDGEHEKAAAKMREIRAIERELTDRKSDLKAQAATSRAVEKMRYDTVVDRLEAAYPVLNPDHEDHDPEMARDVLDLATTYRTRGATPADAIQKAAQKLLKVQTSAQERATEVKPRVDAEEAARIAAQEAAKAGKADDKADARRREQVKKNLETSQRQPADTTKLGADSDKAGGGMSGKDVMKMTQRDFEKLDEEALSKMRGDTI